MKKYIILGFMLVSMFFTTGIYADTYKVSVKDSKIEFSATKLLFIGVQGSFSKFNGEIQTNNKKLSSLNGIVDIASIFTDNEKRDKHLKSDDYFNIATYPKIKISATQIKDNILIATITIKGITKDIKFNIDKFAILNNKVQLTLSATINRQQFMLNGSMSAIMNDNVDVFVTLIATK
jgi:polyisoprenoid-binding protein YceI